MVASLLRRGAHPREWVGFGGVMTIDNHSDAKFFSIAAPTRCDFSG